MLLNTNRVLGPFIPVWDKPAGYDSETMPHRRFVAPSPHARGAVVDVRLAP